MTAKKTIILAAILAMLAIPAWAEYRFVELPTLADGGTLGYAINDSGVVVGNSGLPFIMIFGQGHHGFRYEGGVMTDLGALPGSNPEGDPYASGAYDINNAGIAVGASQCSEEEVLGHAVKFVGGEVIDLGTLGGVGSSAAFGINNSGVIVGRAARVDGIGDAFRLTEGEPMVDLGGLPIDLGSGANAVNDSGLVVGWAGYHAFGEQGYVDFVAVVWEDDVIRVIGPLPKEGYPHSEALDVNNAGVVVGTTDTSGVWPWYHHAFSWTSDGGTVDLGSMGPDVSSFAEGINSRGLIVGAVETYLTMPGHTGYLEHAALYDAAQGWFDLHTAWFPGDYVQSRATAINDQGWITGFGTDADGNVRAWLLFVPEPATGMLLMLGGLMLLPRRPARFRFLK